MKKMLVITASVGYPLTEKIRFTENLRATGYTGDISVLTWQPKGISIASLMAERTSAYLEEIKKAQKYDTILTVDLRDVVFQKNPQNITCSELDLFCEAAKIKDCPYNSRWMLESFGKIRSDGVGDNTIICAGSILGNPARMKDVYEWLSLYENYGHQENMDQALLNFLFYDGRFPYARAVSNDEGEVYTVHHVKELRVSHHQILNANGQVPSIVHQLDRHVQLL